MALQSHNRDSKLIKQNRIQFSGASAKKKISDDGSSVVRYKASGLKK